MTAKRKRGRSRKSSKVGAIGKIPIGKFDTKKVGLIAGISLIIIIIALFTLYSPEKSEGAVAGKAVKYLTGEEGCVVTAVAESFAGPDPGSEVIEVSPCENAGDGYNPILYLSGLNNAHASLTYGPTYGNVLCCPKIQARTGANRKCPKGTTPLLWLNRPSNAHASYIAPGEEDANGGKRLYGTPVCVTEAKCSIDPPSLEEGDVTPVINLNRKFNAHLYQDTYSGPEGEGLKIFCSYDDRGACDLAPNMHGKHDPGGGDEPSTICDGNTGKWLPCTPDKMQGPMIDGVKDAYCNLANREWVFCDANIPGWKIGDHVCSKWGEWTVCDASEEGKIYNGALCQSGQWEICNEDNNLQTDSSGKYVCEESVWKECKTTGANTNANLVVGNFHCSANTGKWMGCEEGSAELCMGGEALICNEDRIDEHGIVLAGTEYYCSVDDGKGIWRECGSVASEVCVADRLWTCSEDNNKDIVRDGDNNNRIVKSPANEEGSEDGRKYYCHNNAWIECTNKGIMKGEGVDNARNSERHDNLYVCDGQLWKDIDREWCGPCRGDDDTLCVGSRVLSIADKRDVLADYFDWHFPGNLYKHIGCVDRRECVLREGSSQRGGMYLYDTKARTEAGEQLVCGDNNNWLSCEPGAENIASDGGRYLCHDADPDDDAPPEWVECAHALNRQQKGYFTCHRDKIELTWKWSSEFACDADKKYWIRTYEGENQYVCDGSGTTGPNEDGWRNCRSLEGDLLFVDPLHPSKNPFIKIMLDCGLEEKAQGEEAELDKAQQISVSESNCNNGIDDDNDGFTDCNDVEDCPGVNAYTLGVSVGSFYELVLRKGDCFTTNVMDEDGETVYEEFNVCDTRTSQSREHADTCEQGNSKQIIESVEYLSNANSRPFQEGSITFIYTPGEELDHKMVGLIHTVDITDEDVRLPLAPFHGNLLSGQRLMITLNGEYYLLSHQQAELFDSKKLLLQHIPLQEVYEPERVAGTNKYSFTTFDLSTITVEESAATGEFVISSQEISEVAAAYVVRQNLARNFEVQFKQMEPVNIADPEIGMMTICRDDISSDEQQTQVCHENSVLRTLMQNNLDVHEVLWKPYAFLYEYVAVPQVVEEIAEEEKVVEGEQEAEEPEREVIKEKRISIFTVHDIGREVTPIDNRDFIEKLSEDYNGLGRRMAIRFGEELYLMNHPAGKFSLQKIYLTQHKNRVVTKYVGTGSEDRMEFMVPNGKITLQRKYGEGPPPFQLTALTPQQIIDIPVNLEDVLFTSFSSQVPVKVTAPFDYGIVSKGEDIAWDKTHFKIAGDIDPNKKIKLRYRRPLVDEGNTLFFYHTAEIVEGEAIKTTGVYRLYDVSGGMDSRRFDDKFISVFSQGNELALKVARGVYYLLGYQRQTSVPGQPDFWDPEKLTLRKLGLNEYMDKELDDNFVATFFLPEDREKNLPEGQIKIFTDEGEIIFSTQERAAREAMEFEGYMTTLLPINKITIDGVEAEMCTVNAYKSVPAIKVCFNDGRDPIVVDPVKLVATPNNNYFFESNQALGDAKEIKVRLINQLNVDTAFEESDWKSLGRQILTGNEPVFNISGSIYRPHATADEFGNYQLAQFALQKYPDGELQYPLVTQITPITFNGSIIMGSDLVYIEQRDTDNPAVPIEATFTVQPYKYLPDDGSELELLEDNSREFITSLYGSIYTLTAIPRNPRLASVILEKDDGTTVFNRVFAQGDTRDILLDGVLTEFRITELTADDVNVTMARAIG